MGQLDQFLSDHAEKPFSWSDNNCLRFVHDALAYMGKDNIPSEWCKGYKSKTAALRAYKQNLAKYDFKDIIEAMDDRFDRIFTLHPRDGMIASRKSESVMGYAFGITHNKNCIFVTEKGLRSFNVEAGDMFWRAD